jgi:hypothetical protein
MDPISRWHQSTFPLDRQRRRTGRQHRRCSTAEAYRAGLRYELLLVVLVAAAVLLNLHPDAPLRQGLFVITAAAAVAREVHYSKARHRAGAAAAQVT